MNHIKIWLAFLAAIIALLLELFIPSNGNQPKVSMNYYLYFSYIICIVTFVISILSYLNHRIRKSVLHKGLFYAVVILFIAVLNILTEKTGVLPTIYFPSPSRTLAVLIEDRELILKCFFYSSRILLIGFFGGGTVGILSGIAIGFSKHVRYWLNPLVRFIGPIPSTAWIPLVLVAFPDTVSASSFLIALAVWFPTTLMTSSGIQNVSNSFFEVSETLGANLFYKIFKIAVPAAMPSIFIGIFNGTCASFITLMTAEMIGAKYGIGWYVNWQKEMMCYANVYAGLIVIAAVCSVLITLLFKLKDRLLIWQKGTIKW